MATHRKSSPAKVQTQLQTIADGLSASTLAQLTTVVVLGSNLTKSQAIAKLRTWIALYAAATTAKQAYLSALTARNASEATALQFLASLITYLKLMVGPNDPAMLAALGITPPKARQQPDVETKAIAKAKSAATRKARGTMSKQQRQSVTVIPEPTLHVVGAGVTAATSAATPSAS